MEQRLVEAARQGDRAAFDALVRMRLDSVYRTTFAILGHDADAQDATQEAFVAAWRNLPRLRDPERFDAWLGRIVVNACRMTLRRRRGRVREIAISDGAAERGELGRQPEPGTAGAEAEAFDRAFEQLSIDDRSLLVLHHHHELGLAEIAARLDIPIGTAKSRLFRARRLLERALEAENR